MRLFSYREIKELLILGEKGNPKVTLAGLPGRLRDKGGKAGLVHS